MLIPGQATVLKLSKAGSGGLSLTADTALTFSNVCPHRGRVGVMGFGSGSPSPLLVSVIRENVT